jgi:hemoglobin-like flavoprotein
MNHHVKALIRNSWEGLAWESPQMVERFHVHLFNVDPEIQAIFSSANLGKVTGIMRFFDVAVGLLDQPELLRSVLLEYGRKHVTYGVLQSHYLGFGDALQLTLGEALGPKFTVEAQDAWSEFYHDISKVMIDGACQQRDSF